MKSDEQWCFSIVKKTDEGLLTMVFQQRKKSKQVLDRVVSSIKIVRKWQDWNVLGVGKK
jgi:hypothetical protein